MILVSVILVLGILRDDSSVGHPSVGPPSVGHPSVDHPSVRNTAR